MALVIEWYYGRVEGSEWAKELGSKGTHGERYGRGRRAEYNAEGHSDVETE